MTFPALMKLQCLLLFLRVSELKQSRYRPGVVQGFQEVKVRRFNDNGT